MQHNPFPTIQSWIPQILSEIKKDIKKDHLTQDKLFYKAHFGSRPLNKLSQEEIQAVYEKELLEGNPELVEWVVNRWVFKHGDLYQRFADALSKIHPEFHTIESLTEAESNELLASLSDCTATEIYLFSRINSVVFPEVVFEVLRSSSEKECALQKELSAKQEEDSSLTQELERLRREASREKEKYEDKLAGVQKKYQTDVDALKKQIRSLQQRLGNS